MRRHLFASTRLAGHADWPGLAQVCQLTRTTRSGGKTTVEVVHAITSLPPKTADASALLAYWRGHWQIESMHWVRDVTFGEDRCRVKHPVGGKSLACFRNAALNLLRTNQVKGVTAALRDFVSSPTKLLKFLRILKQ